MSYSCQCTSVVNIETFKVAFTLGSHVVSAHFECFVEFRKIRNKTLELKANGMGRIEQSITFQKYLPLNRDHSNSNCIKEITNSMQFQTHRFFIVQFHAFNYKYFSLKSSICDITNSVKILTLSTVSLCDKSLTLRRLVT